jgi:hypothetical protein
MRFFASVIMVGFMGITIGMPVPVQAKDIKLGFSPEKHIEDIDTLRDRGWMGHAVLVREMKDERNKGKGAEQGDVLGVSETRYGELYVTSDHVAPFYGRSLMFILSKNNIGLVRQDPSLVIEPALKYLYVREGNSYQGKALINFSVYTKAGQKVWEGDVADSSVYWGKTFSEETFLYTMRNTLLNVTRKFVEDPVLNEAIAGLPRSNGISNRLVINSPRDLGIRGQCRLAPVGPTIASVALLAGATGLLVGGRASNDDAAKVLLPLFSIPMYAVGATILTISIVKWALRINWQSQKSVMGGEK